ncbi:DNA/RNA non-specific endonuclease [Streptococcus suis]|uniref:DNA/RNA non-specific endonuclease n=1 Tax=Streptococcus suis TaxID=1307 RepID=UPI001BAF3798|nr:DNA/RNA non-specific endonuclease [Streptococcus suis]MBS0726048.1 DNA/RNA non-specific endonuclease [Streptococcus suis]
MAKKNVKKQAMSLLSLLATIVVVAGGYLLSDNKSSNVADYSYYVNQSKASEGTPNQELASSVLTEDVKKQLGNSIEWNSAGAFIINGNQTDLDASVASVPYGDNKTKTVQGETVPTVANALLAKSTRQYKDREETGNGRTSWTPAGWHQIHDLTGEAESEDLVPVGSHLEAKAADGSLEFNVFVPNVQSGLSINYHSGEIAVNQ